MRSRPTNNFRRSELRALDKVEHNRCRVRHRCFVRFIGRCNGHDNDPAVLKRAFRRRVRFDLADLDPQFLKFVVRAILSS